jgi:hypothetical protein
MIHDDTMLSIWKDEEQSRGCLLPQKDALQIARELDPDTYMGMTGLESHKATWLEWLRIRQFKE